MEIWPFYRFFRENNDAFCIIALFWGAGEGIFVVREFLWYLFFYQVELIVV